MKCFVLQLKTILGQFNNFSSFLYACSFFNISFFQELTNICDELINKVGTWHSPNTRTSSITSPNSRTSSFSLNNTNNNNNNNRQQQPTNRSSALTIVTTTPQQPKQQQKKHNHKQQLNSPKPGVSHHQRPRSRTQGSMSSSSRPRSSTPSSSSGGCYGGGGTGSSTPRRRSPRPPFLGAGAAALPARSRTVDYTSDEPAALAIDDDEDSESTSPPLTYRHALRRQNTFSLPSTQQRPVSAGFYETSRRPVAGANGDNSPGTRPTRPRSGQNFAGGEETDFRRSSHSICFRREGTPPLGGRRAPSAGKRLNIWRSVSL